MSYVNLKTGEILDVDAALDFIAKQRGPEYGVALEASRGECAECICPGCALKPTPKQERLLTELDTALATDWQFGSSDRVCRQIFKNEDSDNE